VGSFVITKNQSVMIKKLQPSMCRQGVQVFALATYASG